MIINEHVLLKQPIPFVESPNHGGEIQPKYLVLHYTAGRSAQSSVSWLTNPKAKASAHLVIGQDGSITQLVPFNIKAWHAGPSSWDGHTHLNGLSIGIELDNAGRLMRRGRKWWTWFDSEIDEDDVVEAVHKNESHVSGWHVYSAEQLETLSDVARLLVDTYQLQDIIGHDDIAPHRKFDPGPAFPMESFRARILGREKDDEPQYETTGILNIRSGPGVQHPTLPESPLPKGTRLEILERQGHWALANILDQIKDNNDLEGWLHTKYIKLLGEIS